MSKVLDFHHHVAPPEYVDQLAQHGITEQSGFEIKKFDPKKNIRMMDKIKVDKAFLSISVPGVFLKNDKTSADIARICNEYIASMKNQYPNRFGGFAALPFPAQRESLNELEYSLDTLHLDGVCLMTQVNGTYVGEKGYEELFTELNKRKAVVLIHPDDLMIHKGKYAAVTGTMERMIETSRTAYNLYLNGYLEKYRDIKFILSHGGGAIPVLASTIVKESMEKGLNKLDEAVLEKKMDVLRGLYFDLGQRGYEILNGIESFCGSDQIVFGSDYPYVPPFEILNGRKELAGWDKIDRFQEERILSGAKLGLH